MQHCPVLAVTDQFLGPKAVGPQFERFRHPRLEIPSGTVEWCSGCGTCSRVCPHGVEVAAMNIQAKAQAVSRKRGHLRDQLISRPELLGRINHRFASLANAVLELRSVRWLLEKTLGISQHAPMPSFARTPLTIQAADRVHEKPIGTKGRERRIVAYFHGCSANYFEPGLGMLTVQVLEALGCEVVIPPQTCCGLPLQSNGLFDAARDHGHSNVEMLLPFAESGIPILGSSTSCTLELKREYQTVLGLSGSAIETIAGAVFDVFEFIRWELRGPFEEIELSPVPVHVLYHPPCQLKNHGIGLPAEWALRRVPELRLSRSESECCGSAGTYGSKVERYAVARDVGAGLFQQTTDQGVEYVLCDSETCRWWIQSHTGLPSIHPLEIIAAAMGLHELPAPGSTP